LQLLVGEFHLTLLLCRIGAGGIERPLPLPASLNFCSLFISTLRIEYSGCRITVRLHGCGRNAPKRSGANTPLLLVLRPT
jgi:hypothetical protein